MLAINIKNISEKKYYNFPVKVFFERICTGFSKKFPLAVCCFHSKFIYFHGTPRCPRKLHVGSFAIRVTKVGKLWFIEMLVKSFYLCVCFSKNKRLLSWQHCISLTPALLWLSCLHIYNKFLWSYKIIISLLNNWEFTPTCNNILLILYVKFRMLKIKFYLFSLKLLYIHFVNTMKLNSVI